MMRGRFHGECEGVLFGNKEGIKETTAGRI